MAQKETSDWTHSEFCEWAFQRAFNGLVAGGLKGMKDAITYEVVQECARLMRQGGFKETAK